MEVANQSVPVFWPALRTAIGELNAEGTRIVILRIQLRGSTGALLIDYVRDDEIGSTRAWLAPGMNIEGIAYPPPTAEPTQP